MQNSHVSLLTLMLKSEALQKGQGTLALTNLGYVSAATMESLVAQVQALPAGSVYPADKLNFIQTHGLPILVTDDEKFNDFVVNVQVLDGYKDGKSKSTVCPTDEQIYLNKFCLESFSIRLRKELKIQPFTRPTENFYLSSITFAVKPYSNKDAGTLKTDYAELCETALKTFKEQIFEVGQKCILKTASEGKVVLLECTSITVASLGGQDGDDEAKESENPTRGLINAKTTFILDAERGQMTLIGDDRAVRTEGKEKDKKKEEKRKTHHTTPQHLLYSCIIYYTTIEAERF